MFTPSPVLVHNRLVWEVFESLPGNKDVPRSSAELRMLA